MAWPSDAGAAGAAGFSSVWNDLERPRVLPSSRREAAHTRQLAFSIRRQYSTGMPVNVSSSASCERPIAVKRRHVASSCADVCATVPRPRTSATTSTSPSSAGWLASAARESGGEAWCEETDDGEVAEVDVGELHRVGELLRGLGAAPRRPDGEERDQQQEKLEASLELRRNSDS